MQASETL